MHWLHRPLPCLLALLVSTACASSGAFAPESGKSAETDARLASWENVERLAVDTAVRVTRRDGERFYGHVMTVSNLRITLALQDRSESIPRSEVLLVERFPIRLLQAVPRAALGVGAALSLSSSSSPKTYRRTVAPGQESLERPIEQYREGFYVDALGLAGTAIQMAAEAIEGSRTRDIVYRSR